MGTVFTNKLMRRGRIFAVVLFLLWFVVIGFVGLRYWIFTEEDMAAPTAESIKLLDDIFFIVSGVMIVMIGFIGYIVSTLFTSWSAAANRLEQEQQTALKQEQEKIRIKRQLTNNINHELKTPICSILGYLEMINGNENLDNKSIRIFVQKSYDQAERLRQLMADLSTITRIEEGASMVETGSVDVWSVINSVIDDTMPQAEHQSIAIVTNVREKLQVDGNQSLLYSVFRNLIDNAIAYSGGRMVNIELKEITESHYRFAIRDNGIGVEAKHLPHLFERFYRVDSGRSRKAGGTGLGLSIVKNAVIFHGGTIIAKPSSTGGLEFDFTIRKTMDRIV